MAIGEAAAIDVMLPEAAGWGEVRLIMDLPSQGIWWRDLGGARLENLTPGSFSEVSFLLTPDVSTALSGIYTDLRFVVAINGPTMSAPVLVDHLQFEGTDVSVDTDVTAIPFSFNLPKSVTLQSVVVQTNESLHLANVVHAANTTANVINMGGGDTYIGVDAEIDGNVYGGGKAVLDHGAKVHGAVQAGGIIDAKSGAVADEGTLANTSLVVGAQYQWNASWPVVNGVHTVNDGESLNLAPGNYTSVTLNSRGVLNLSAGIYFIDNFVAHADTTMNINGDGSPVIIYVRDSFTCRSLLNHSRSSADFFVGFAGTNPVDLDGPFAGTVVAPNATIRLAPLNGGSHEGSFFAKSIWAEANTPIVRVPFDHWDWLMPPTVSVDCVSRATKQHSAGLFSYYNPLDYPVTILRGLRNDIQTSIERHSPLQYFEPGPHEKFYWLPFVGPELCWTIDGATVCADSSTRGCTLGDYENTLVKNDIWPLSYSDNYPYLKDLIAPDADWEYVTNSSSDLDLVEPEETDFSDGWMIAVDDYVAGDGWWDDIDMEFVLDGESITKDMCEKPCDICAGACVHPWAVTFSFQGKEYTDNIPFSLYIIEREDNEIGDDYNKLAASYELSPDGQTLYDGNTAYNWSNGGTISAGGWAVSFDVIPSDTRICVNWEIQYAGDIGEDDLADTDIQSVPASFAYVKLRIDGEKASFSDWSGYYPLDKDGCIPEKYTPTRANLTPDDSNTPVTVHLDIAGRLEYLDENGSGTNTKWDVTDESSQVFIIHKEINAEDIISNGGIIPVRNRNEEPYNNEYTKAAAVVSHIFRNEASGRDMGILETDLRIKANYSSNDFPFYDTLGTVLLRPDGAGGRGSKTIPFGDASRKFSVAHEIGHAVQDSYVSSFNVTGPSFYEVGLRDTDGDFHVYYESDTDTDNEIYKDIWGVDECLCHVEKDHSNKHCMQSLEMPNVGIGEGFANFYSSMVWNDPDDNDCKYGYPKAMYVPSCPENSVDCQTDDCTDTDVSTRCYDAQQVLDDTDSNVLDYMNDFPTDPEDGWKISIGLTAVECNINSSGAQRQWQTWRNEHCLDANATEDLKQLGVEMDWTHFYSELYRTSDTDERWSMRDMMRVLETADADTDTDNIAGSAKLVTYEMMLDEAQVDTELSNDQKTAFERLGRNAGVSKGSATP